MAFDLPLPKAIPDAPLGGRTFGVYNSLTQNALANRKQEIENQYAPITQQAEAASKLAYANLMGPQFLAKVLGNENLLSNLSPAQQQAGLASVYSAGTGSGTGNALGGFSSTQPQSGLQNIVNHVKGLLGYGNAPAQNAFNQPTPYQQAPAPAPMQAPTQPTAAPSPVTGSNVDSGYSFDKYGNNIKASPDQIADKANGVTAPATGTEPFNQDTLATNAGRFEGIKEQNKELGKVRADQIKGLDDVYEQSINAEVPLQHMNEIVRNPVFQNLRQFPAFQSLQLNTEAKFGSPAEQKLIGDFQATGQRVIAETIKSFGGRILDKEITLSNQMKVTPDDNINVMLGKLPSIETFQEMTKQRARIASRLMAQQNISKTDALEQADKMVDGSKIRSRIENELQSSTGGLNDTEGREPPEGTVWMQSKTTGKYWPVHKDHMNDPNVLAKLKVVE